MLSNEKQIYNITPITEINYTISKKKNEFSFYSDNHLKIAEEIRYKNEISAIMVFTSGDEIVEKIISQIELTRAY